jgi:hypothetical protein
MTASLSILTLALLGQADAFTLHFEGFISTREMNQQQLNKMFRAAFEQVSDEPESLFAISDSPNADVLVSASQTLDLDELVFHWSLSTTRCPIRHLEFDQRRPKHALNFDESKVMVREVAHKAHDLLHGHVGQAGLACLEEGESMGGTATVVSEYGDGLDEGYPAYGYGGYGYAYGHNTLLRGSAGGTATIGAGARPSVVGTPASRSGTASFIVPGHVPAGTVAPAPTGTASGPKPATATVGNTGASLPHGGSGVGATTGHGHH